MGIYGDQDMTDIVIEIICWIYFILNVPFFVYTAIWNIKRFFHEVKHYILFRRYRSPEYLFKYYYEKHFNVESPTEEDIQLLHDLLTEFKERQESA